SLVTIVTFGGYFSRTSNSSTKSDIQNSPHVAVVEPVKNNVSTDLLTSESTIKSNEQCHLLSNVSSLLLLILTTQAGSIEKTVSTYSENNIKDSNSLGRNPYRTTLFSLQDEVTQKNQVDLILDTTHVLPKSTPRLQPGGATLNGHLNIVTQSSSPQINFTAICDTAASTLSQDSSPLLLYLLVHRNTNFHSFIMQERGYEKVVRSHFLYRLCYKTPT
ncbi:unnamed protein product, partial [Schistosoma mattheei]